MKFQIQREDLLIPLQKIIGAGEKRQTMPALANILVRADTSTLSLTATDLEIELVTTSSIVPDETGETTLPARKLLDICKALPEEANISILVEADKAIVKSGRSRFSLSTLPANDFPSLDSISPVAEFEIPQKNNFYNLIKNFTEGLIESKKLIETVYVLKKEPLKTTIFPGEKIWFSIDTETNIPNFTFRNYILFFKI